MRLLNLLGNVGLLTKLRNRQSLRHTYCFIDRRGRIMAGKKTVLIGATTDQTRYAYRASNSLVNHGHLLIPMGIKEGKVAGEDILLNKPDIEGTDTVTLYINPGRQPEWYNYVLKLKPKRIIFNPGTENQEFMELAKKAGIEVVEGCTLVMLSIGTY